MISKFTSPLNFSRRTNTPLLTKKEKQKIFKSTMEYFNENPLKSQQTVDILTKKNSDADKNALLCNLVGKNEAVKITQLCTHRSKFCINKKKPTKSETKLIEELKGLAKDRQTINQVENLGYLMDFSLEKKSDVRVMYWGKKKESAKKVIENIGAKGYNATHYIPAPDGYSQCYIPAGTIILLDQELINTHQKFVAKILTLTSGCNDKGIAIIIGPGEKPIVDENLSKQCFSIIDFNNPYAAIESRWYSSYQTKQLKEQLNLNSSSDKDGEEISYIGYSITRGGRNQIFA